MLLMFAFAVSKPTVAQSDLKIPDLVAQAEQERIATIKRIAPSVVAIFDPSGQGGGSGVLIEPSGFTATNFHVVQGATTGFMKCGLNDGQFYDAVIVGIDPTGDVALIKLLGRDDFPHAEIGDSDSVRAGDWTLALGNPFLLADDFQPTVTYGMVSGTHRYQYPAGTFLEYTDCIQVDASINPGNSGGPLFDMQGKLIGINGRISVEKRGRVNVGAGYAISINQVMHFLDHLKSGRIVDHATLGATVRGDSDGTVSVANILESSEVYRRGLRRGDELISFAGRPVRSVNQFKNILGIYPKDWQVPLSYQRDGKRYDTIVRLAGLHRRAELVPNESLEEEQPEPGPRDGEREPKPRLMPHPQRQKVPEAPEEYKDLYEERTGFANYYFNKVATDELLDAVRSFGDYKITPRRWSIQGKIDAAKPVEVRLLQDTIAAKFGDEFALLPLDQELQPLPAESGGLLPAIYQLQQLLIDPHDYFTELYYVGSQPLDGQGVRVDVLITTKGTLTSRWYFDKTDKSLIGWDSAVDDDHDPCELRIKQFGEFLGKRFPTKLEIRHAGELWGVLTIESLETFEPDAKEKT